MAIMSTSSLVGRYDHRSRVLHGVLVYWDGYPSRMGPLLAHHAASLGTEALLETLAAHPSWSVLEPDTETCRSGEAAAIYGSDKYVIVEGVGVAHAGAGCVVEPWTTTEPLDLAVEYAYGIDAESGKLYIFDNRVRAGSRARRVAVLGLDADPAAVDWTRIECGETFRRCGHVAGAHIEGLPYEAACVPMSIYLGRRKPDERVACAAEVNGRTYRRSGRAMLATSDIAPARIIAALVDGRSWMRSYADGERFGHRRHEYWCWVDAVADDGTVVPLLPVTRQGHPEKPLPGVAFRFPEMANSA